MSELGLVNFFDNTTAKKTVKVLSHKFAVDVDSDTSTHIKCIFVSWLFTALDVHKGLKQKLLGLVLCKTSATEVVISSELSHL